MKNLLSRRRGSPDRSLKNYSSGLLEMANPYSQRQMKQHGEMLHVTGSFNILRRTYLFVGFLMKSCCILEASLRIGAVRNKLQTIKCPERCQ